MSALGAASVAGRYGEAVAVATITSLLADHVTLQVRSVDRIFLAGYVPKLQCAGQVVRFLNERAGGTIPSPAILGKAGRAYVAAVDAFALDHGVAAVRFGKGECKEDVAREHFERAEREGRFGVVLIGRRRADRCRAGEGVCVAWLA